MSVSWTPVWDLFYATLLREPPAMLLAIVVGIGFVLAMALEGIHVSLMPKRFVRRHPHLHPTHADAAPVQRAQSFSAPPPPAFGGAATERLRLKPRRTNPKKRISVVKKKSRRDGFSGQGKPARYGAARSKSPQADDEGQAGAPR